MEDPVTGGQAEGRAIALTVCPLSNVALRVVNTLGDHMLPGMLDAGLLATVNSDDPAYFGGYVDDNLAAVRHAFGYDDGQMAALARNSFDACFAPEADKRAVEGRGRRLARRQHRTRRGGLEPAQEPGHDVGRRSARRPRLS